MPIAMIAPMNDCMFSVVPVSSSMSSTPQSTAGMVSTIASASRSDWKFAASSRKITSTASSSPVRRPEMVCSSGGISPRIRTVTPRGGAPAAAMRLSQPRRGLARA